jgi:putative transposase
VKGSINTLEKEHVVVSKMELYELLCKADSAGVNFLREGVRTLAQALMEVEVTDQVGADRGERAPERRVTQRNGYRPRGWDTRVGTMTASPSRRSRGSAKSSTSWSMPGVTGR